MPIFEYTCESCHAEFERLVLTSAAAQSSPNCVHCGSHDVARRLSVFSARSGGPGARGPAGGSSADSVGRRSGGGCCTPGSCGCH